VFINKINIKNFGAIDSIEKTFSRINLIMGDNGSGKSTFLSTLVYSLCNYLDLKIEDYIKTGSKKFEIQTDFNHLNNHYLLNIEGSGKGSEKELIVNGSEKFKNSQAIEYIEHYIHKPKLTLASSFTLQGKGSDILFESNTKRVERLKQIFDIDKLNNVGLHLKQQIEELKISIRDLEVENTTLQNMSYDYKDIPEKPNEENIKTLKLKKAQLEKDKIDYEKHVILYNNYKEQLEIYETTQTEIKIIKSNIKKYNNNINEIKKDLKEVDDSILKQKDSELQVINEKLNQLNDALLKYDKVQEIKESIEKNENELLLLKPKRVPRKPEGLEELRKELLHINTEINVMNNKTSLVDSGKCPTCGQDYTEYTIDEFNNKKKELEINKNDLESKIINLEKALENYNKIIIDNDKIIIKKENYEKELNKLKNDLNYFNITDSKEQINDDIKINKENKNNILGSISGVQDDLRRNNDILKEISNLQNNIKLQEKDLENKLNIKKPEFIKEPILFNEEEYNNISNIIEEQQILLTNYNNFIEYNKMLKETEDTNKKKINDNIDVLNNLRNKSLVKERTKKIIEKDFASWLIDHGSRFIKDKMNKFFMTSYGKFIIDLKQDDKSIDFYYSEDDEHYLNVVTASGYEKEILALSFRMALCDMQNIGLLMLDEVDSFSKESNSLRLYESVMKENFEQIFSITHYEKTQDYLLSNYNCNIIQL
jgi:DNA repair exonuclease SbcCD ATPase subunit